MSSRIRRPYRPVLGLALAVALLPSTIAAASLTPEPASRSSRFT